MDPELPINTGVNHLCKPPLPRSEKVSESAQNPNTFVASPLPLGGGGYGVVYAKFRKSLQQFPQPGQGVHHHILSCANYGVRAGLTDYVVFDMIMEAMPRLPRGREIEEALEKAGNNPPSGKKFSQSESGVAIEREAKPDPIAAVYAMKHAIEKAGGPIALEQLQEESPVPLGPLDDPNVQRSNAYRLVNSLHSQDEHIFCGGTYDTKINTVAGWEESLKGSVPPLWIPNSLTGEEALTGTGKKSYRCDNAVSDFRYLLFECDHKAISLGEQAAFIRSRIAAGWPIRSVVFSGGKSLHALLEVNCQDREAWNQELKSTLKPTLVALGADPACFNPSRLSRLPGHHREDKNKLQSLVWLSNKHAIRTPHIPHKNKENPHE